MPMYEYSCKECGEIFEKLVRLSDSDREIKCPKCGAYKTKRLFSVFGIGGDVNVKDSSAWNRSRGPACGSG